MVETGEYVGRRNERVKDKEYERGGKKVTLEGEKVKIKNIETVIFISTTKDLVLKRRL